MLHRTTENRYDIHELLRQYAAEKLEQTAEVSEVRSRHVAYYCAFLDQCEADLKGTHRQEILAEIETDSENARAAWQWAVEWEKVEYLEQALDSLGLFYLWRSRLYEGEAMCRLATDKLGIQEFNSWTLERTRVLVKILTWHGLFNRHLGQTDSAYQQLQQALTLLDSPALAGQDTRPERAHALLQLVRVTDVTDREKARQLGEQSLAIYRTLNDQWGTAHALTGLGMLAYKVKAYAEAKPLFEECLAIRQPMGDPAAVNSLLMIAAIAADQGQFTEALTLLQQAVDLFKERGNLTSPAALGTLGYTLMHLGQYETARSHCQTALTFYQEMGIRSHLKATAQVDLGAVWLAEEAYAEARQILQESMATARDIGELWVLGESLALLGHVTRAMGDSNQAQQYLVEALKLAQEMETTQYLSYALPLAALLLADRGEPERAVELYTFASQNPFVANSRWFEDVAGRHIAAVAATLPLEVVAAAQERGRARELWETARELLAELEQ